MSSSSSKRPVIVLVAFGTSVPKAQSALERIDTAVGENWPDYDIRWAFTSRVILRKLRRQERTTLFAREVPLKDLGEVFADLRAEGIGEAVVQSLHVAPGQEYEKLRNTPADGLRVHYGHPLLADAACVVELAETLAPRFGDHDEVTILCGHGNDNFSEFNERLITLDQYVRKQYDHVFVATVEGEPGTDGPLADAAAAGKARVRFVPVMVVAGDHILNDVMGEDEESWASRLGLPATCEPGLGENDDVIALFLDRLRAALEQAAPLGK